MNSHRRRLLLLAIPVLLGLCVIAYFLHATSRYHHLQAEEQQRLADIARISRIPLNRLAGEVYRDHLDFRAEIQASDLPAALKQEAISKLDSLRGPFAREIGTYRRRAIVFPFGRRSTFYVELELDAAKLLDQSAKDNDETGARLISEVDSAQKRNADAWDALGEAAALSHTLLNRYWGNSGQSDAEVIAGLREDATEAVNKSVVILRSRLYEASMKSASIIRSGSNRVVVALPVTKAVIDTERVRELVGRTALLEFKFIVDPERSRDILTNLDRGIATRLGRTPADTPKAAKTDSGTTDASKLFKETAADTDDTTSHTHPLLSLMVGGSNDIIVSSQNRGRVAALLSLPEYRDLVPPDVEFLWSNVPRHMQSMRDTSWVLYLVRKRAEMTGSTLEDAQTTIGSGYDPEQSGRPVVNIKFNREGSRVFARVTGANVGKRLAIVLDDKVYMAPNIRDKISGGQAIITGLSDMQKARDIAVVLRAGALPARFRLVN